MSEPETVFPPRDEWDIAAYDPDQCMAGYREHHLDDPAPGENHHPAYRWGWANRRRDTVPEPDGYESLRSKYIALTRTPQ